MTTHTIERHKGGWWIKTVCQFQGSLAQEHYSGIFRTKRAAQDELDAMQYAEDMRAADGHIRPKGM